MKRRIDNLTKRIKRYLKDDFNFRSTESRVVEKMAFFEAFDGTSQTCHPLAIFEHLLHDPDFASHKFIWSYRGESPNGYTWQKYKNTKNVIWVKHGSHKYFHYLSRAKFLISNSTFPHQFTKNSQQIYLNTWHGIPLKKMGNDIPLGIPGTRNVIRNLMSADFILSSNEFMTHRIWAKSFKLQGLFNGNILELGSPRLDKQIHPTQDLDILRRNLGISTNDSREIVLFAPTWKGASPSEITDSSKFLLDSYGELSNRLDSTKYIVLLKVHQLALRAIGKSRLSEIRTVDTTVPTNAILPAISQLVTDDSSIAFDFLLHDRPIHFLFPQNFSDDARGLYFAKSDLPGTINETIEGVAAAIKDSKAEDQLHLVREKWISTYLTHEDGLATKRVIDRVFKGLNPEDDIKLSDMPEKSKKILIHVGSLIANGITTAAINLANELAANGHDVSIFYPYSKKEHQVAKVYEFDSKVRHFPRVGNIALPLKHRKSYRRYLSDGGRQAVGINIPKIRRIFAREWVRCFGAAKFDTVIAFDGYSVFWAELLLASGAESKFIWMHNDLMQDANRTIDGNKPHFKNLTSLFTLYDAFDKVVSVSPDLTTINREKMSEFAPGEKFCTVQNFINHCEVRRLADEYRSFAPAANSRNFVTVGRLSPEKNQARMIRAMRLVVDKHPETQLYIVGDGPLYSSLEGLIANLHLKGNVHLLGYHRNPHALVKKCDYFVFSSIYEGQGLAVIEAMVLGKPVVTTRYNVVESVVGPRDGIITDNSDEALAAGMLSFLEHGHPRPKFSAEEHNSAASEELRLLISSR